MDDAIDFDVTGGYYPSTSFFPPPSLWNTIKAGSNLWLRAANRLQVANGSAQLSATNVGARIFPLNDSRAEIAGALVSNRLPFASFIRLPSGVLMFLSELTSQQVYVNEAALTGVTTATSAGILRVAVPDGVGGYNTFDAGFNAPNLPSGNVTTPAGGVLAMAGTVAVALCAWRTVTNAISAPSNLVVTTLAASDIVSILLPAAVSGQDGWIFGGTETGGDQTLPLRVVRYVRITPRGTFTSDGTVDLVGDANTRWLSDLRPGDIITPSGGGGSRTIATVTGQAAATLTAVLAAGAGQTMTITTASAEWVETSLGRLIDFDVFKPVKAAGVFQFMNRVLLWGAAAESASAVTGPAIFAMLPDNPEHIGLFNITTTYGDDILNIMGSGDNRSNNLFLMTRGTLEIVTFTGETDAPYRIRIKYQPGFKTAKAGVVYKDTFYGFAQRPFRTRIEADTDIEFGTPVFTEMDGWTADNVTMGIDPKNECVLYAHYDGSATTKVLPFMEQLGVWGVPISITGQVTDWATVAGVNYCIVLTGGNYRVFTWEGGAGASGAFVGSQYVHDAQRWKIKGLVFQGYADAVRIYVAVPGFLAEVSSTVGAAATFLLSSGGTALQPFIFTNLAPGRGVAVRCDFPNATTSQGVFQKLQLTGYRLETLR